MYKIYKKANVEYRKECERCHSLFSFDDEEIMTCTKGSKSDILKFVDCPVCGYTMDVDSSDAYGLVNEESGDKESEGFSSFIQSITEFLKHMGEDNE